MKVSEKQIEKMKILFNEGKKFREIGRKLNLSYNTVIYHLFPERRIKTINKNKTWFKNLPKEKRQTIAKKYSDYRLEWTKNKYHKDEKFRKERQDYQKKYYYKTREKKNE